MIFVLVGFFYFFIFIQTGRKLKQFSSSLVTYGGKIGHPDSQPFINKLASFGNCQWLTNAHHY